MRTEIGAALFRFVQFLPARFAQLKKYAGETGKDWQDPFTQLDFSDKEIHEMTPEFFQAQGIPEQTRILTGGWEKPAKPGTCRLKKLASQARILIQPMQAFYCCIVCIAVIDAERD
jgi:hypothetical protein